MDERLKSVVAATNANRATFEEFCRSLSSEELERVVPGGSWRVKDYIAHLASIDLWVGEWFAAVAEGNTFIPRGEDGGRFDIDRWNEARIVERRDASVDDLLREAAANRERLFETFPRFSAEALASEFTFRGKVITFIEYLEAWTLHDPAHSLDMLKALPERSGDPELRAWLEQFSGGTMRAVADVEARLP